MRWLALAVCVGLVAGGTVTGALWLIEATFGHGARVPALLVMNGVLVARVAWLMRRADRAG